MINYQTGDLLQSQAEALVNTVNTVGVMGKSIAIAPDRVSLLNFSKKMHPKGCKNKNNC
jgi:O-acetyl-ADP-ribose deacetylase (regulator of RNase III)